MKSNNRSGGAELLMPEHLDCTNIRGSPLVGWTPAKQGLGGLVNPAGWAMLRVVLWKWAEAGADGQRVKAWLYDQVMLVENPGAVVVCHLGDRVGLVQNWRMVGERVLDMDAGSYIRVLDDHHRWKAFIASLGQNTWECPKGLAPANVSASTLEAYVIKTAKLEAGEEAGYTIENVTIASRVNANPTFFAHSQHVVKAKVRTVGGGRPEDLEMIGSSHLFTPKEVRRLANNSELVDGMSMAALWLCGF